MEDSKVISPDEEIAMLTSVNEGYAHTIKAQRFSIDLMRRFIREVDAEIRANEWNVVTLEFYLALKAKYFANLN